MEKFELRKTMTFESAHRLPHLPPDHKCSRLHGHSFSMTLVVRGPLDPSAGWVMDYSDLKKSAQPIIDQLDHHYLNEIEGLENPTSEILAKWVYDRLRSRLSALHQVIIAETCTTECTYPAH